MSSNVAPRPFTVIAGFLGAGKTTLVNHVLTQAKGVRYAVLVNDFGAVNVDAGLIAEHDGQTLALTNGCICCSMADGFIQTMLQLMAAPETFDHVIVEASGVAEPSKIMDFARLDPLLEPDAIVTLVDAETVAERLEDARVGSMVAAQIRQGDLLVLNKVDLAKTDEAMTHLSHLNPEAPVVRSENADLPLDAVLGLNLYRGISGAGTAAHPEFHTQLVRADTPVSIKAFETWQDMLPPFLLRGKGRIVLSEGGPHLWQRVGTRGTLIGTDGGELTSEIVLIAAEPFEVANLANGG